MFDFLEYISDLFDGSDNDLPDIDSTDSGLDDCGIDATDCNTIDAGDSMYAADGTDCYETDGMQSVDSMLNNGITQDSVSDDEYQRIAHDGNKGNPSFLGITAAKCTLCSCQHYDGKIGNGNCCSCGHTIEQHEWI